jgi:hypothetical protein
VAKEGGSLKRYAARLKSPPAGPVAKCSVGYPLGPLATVEML